MSPPPTAGDRTDPSLGVSRRRLLRRSVGAAATAAAGALGAAALNGPGLASAANGDPVRVGNLTVGTALTTVRNNQDASDAVALKGLVATTGPGGGTAGVWGQSWANNGNGVFGIAMAGNSKGVWGRTANGSGVYGQATGTSGINHGVYGVSESPSGRGVSGKGGLTGVYGESTTNLGAGVQGKGGKHGVYGIGNDSGVRGLGTYGVYGLGTTAGMYGTGNKYGIYAVSSDLGWGVYGKGGTVGVVGQGSSQGVYGGSHTSTGIGVMGVVTSASTDATAVLGVAEKAPGYAGLFFGTVYVKGVLAGTNKAFLIDHPLDPANRTLTHSCVEAPEMLNVYGGTVRLDARGRATVRLPRYFEALNRDHRYQLTAIGGGAPGLHVAREIERNRFSIAGGQPGQKVCWQVSGARQDAWARTHPLRVDTLKRRNDRGRYLNPEAFGKPKSAGVHRLPTIRARRLRGPKALE
jgi:hypothetical protein